MKSICSRFRGKNMETSLLLSFTEEAGGGKDLKRGGNGGMSFAITKNDSSKPNYIKHMAFLA